MNMLVCNAPPDDPSFAGMRAAFPAGTDFRLDTLRVLEMPEDQMRISFNWDDPDELHILDPLGRLTPRR
jgi:hypothetical protein